MTAMDRPVQPGRLCAAGAVLLLVLCLKLPGAQYSAAGAENRAAQTASAGTERARSFETATSRRGRQQPKSRSTTRTVKPRPARQLSTSDRRPRQTAATSAAGKGPNESQAVTAREFAAAHHAELIPLLDQLEQSSPRQYQQAVSELARASDRLRRIRHNMPGRYEQALAGWKLDSRIRLLAARMSADDSPRLSEELRSLLRARLSLRQQELHHEQERLTARLEQVQQMLQRIESDPEAQVERDFLRVQRMLRRGTPGGKPTRPAGSAVSTESEGSPRRRQPAGAAGSSVRQPVVAPQPR